MSVASVRKTLLYILFLLVLGGAYLGVAHRDELRAWWTRQQTPRIVLVTLDTFNIRFTSLVGAPPELTPVLEGIADEGTRFHWAHGPVPLTLPAHTTMLSGVDPETTGVWDNGDFVPQGLMTFPEVLQSAGYRTAAFTSLGVLKGKFGLRRGFDDYDDQWEGIHRRWYRTADEVVPAALSWVDEHRSEPFFLWVHLSDTHEPRMRRDAPPDTEIFLQGESLKKVNLARREQLDLTLTLPPGKTEVGWQSLGLYPSERRPQGGLYLELLEPEALAPYLREPLEAEKLRLSPGVHLELFNESPVGRQVHLRFSGQLIELGRKVVRRRYLDQVTLVDSWLGKLREDFRQRRLFEDTLWIVVSDHGEGVMFHDTGGHSEATFEDQLRLVWLMQGPNVPAGQVVEDPVRMRDVAPTVLDTLGLGALEAAEGVSREPCWRGSPCAPPEPWWAYGINHRQGRIAALAGYRWPYKLVWTLSRPFGPAVFRLPEDPWEETSLPLEGSSVSPEAETLGRQAPRRRARYERLLEEHQSQIELEDEDRSMLRSLGY